MEEHRCKKGEIKPKQTASLDRQMREAAMRSRIIKEANGWNLLIERSTAGDEDAEHRGLSGMREVAKIPILVCPFCATTL